MRRPDSFSAQALTAIEPLLASLWILFLVWTALLGTVWIAGIGPAEVEHWVHNPGLRAALQAFIQFLDPVWIALASVQVYRQLIEAEGLNRARRWALGAFIVAILIAWISVKTQFPMGPIHYTARLGKQLGPVPCALPLLCIAIVLSAREVALWISPRAAHWQSALLAAVLTMLTVINLEPVASTLRSWWLWFPVTILTPSPPPMSNAATWLVVSFLGALLLRPRQSSGRSTLHPYRPLIVFGLLNGLCLLTHFLRLAR